MSKVRGTTKGKKRTSIFGAIIAAVTAFTSLRTLKNYMKERKNKK